jgi:hypothetical protein
MAGVGSTSSCRTCLARARLQSLAEHCSSVRASLRMEDWDWSQMLKELSAWKALKAGFVVFLYCLMILLVISIVLAMFGVYS